MRVDRYIRNTYVYACEHINTHDAGAVLLSASFAVPASRVAGRVLPEDEMRLSPHARSAFVSCIGRQGVLHFIRSTVDHKKRVKSDRQSIDLRDWQASIEAVVVLGRMKLIRD